MNKEPQNGEELFDTTRNKRSSCRNPGEATRITGESRRFPNISRSAEKVCVILLFGIKSISDKYNLKKD